jgi:tetratricopeptide (TPR) repeat protein
MMARFIRILILISFVALVIAGAAEARFWPSKDAWRARQLLLQKRWEEAAAAFQRAVDRGERSPAEREGLAYALLKAGQFQPAAREYGYLCDRYPRTASFWVNLGLAYAYQERPDLMPEAEKAFRKALALNPRDPDALLNLAVLLHRMGRPGEALAQYQAAALAARQKGYVWAGLADGLRDQGGPGDLGAAYWLYQSALRRADEAPGALLGMARLLLIRASRSQGKRASRDYADAVAYAKAFVRRTGVSREQQRRWRRDIGEASHLIEVAEARSKGALPSRSDTAPPRIRLLWPPEGQLKADVAALHVDRDQLGVVGVVLDEQPLVQVTVNGVYPDYIPLGADEVKELRDLFQGKEAAPRDLPLSKIAGLLSKSAGLLSKGAGPGAADHPGRDSGGSSGLYLFSAGVPLTGPETLIHIVAADSVHPPLDRAFTVRRPASARSPRWPVPPTGGNTWALFIGVDQYEIPGVPSLLYAASDARRLYTTIRERIGDPDRVAADRAAQHAFLLASGSDEPPTRENIEKRLQQIGTGVQPADTVLIFFSGHGCTTGGNTYLLTSDANAGRLNEAGRNPDASGSLKKTALDREALGSMLKPLKARRVVVFLDACHAAGVLEQPGGLGALARDPAYQRFLSDGLEGCYLLVSCGQTEYSYEDPIGLKGGVFAHFLEQGLAGDGDKDGDGVVQLGELASYVETKVRAWCLPPDGGGSKLGRATQTPQRFPPSGWTEDVPLVVTPVGAARAALERLRAHLGPTEYQEAEAGLRSDPDRSILTAWLLELDASLPEAAGSRQQGPEENYPAITLAEYRRYREALRGNPDSLTGQVYRILPPRQALLAVQHLPAGDTPQPTQAEQEWSGQVGRLIRKEVPPDRFLDWVDDRLRADEPAKP